MSGKLNWLDKFAEEQAKKIEKTANLNKPVKHVVVDVDEFTDVKEGQEVLFENQLYRVLNANYQDENGSGIVLEFIDEDVTLAEETEEVTAEEATTEETVAEEILDDEVDSDVLAEVELENPEDVEDVLVEGNSAEVSLEMELGTSKEDLKKLDTQTEPLRARQDDKENYHIEVRDTVEFDKYCQEAVETEKQVAHENTIDLSKPENRTNRILKRILNDYQEEEVEELEVELDDEVEIESDVELVDETEVELESEVEDEDTIEVEAENVVEDEIEVEAETEMETETETEAKIDTETEVEVEELKTEPKYKNVILQKIIKQLGGK